MTAFPAARYSNIFDGMNVANSGTSRSGTRQMSAAASRAGTSSCGTPGRRVTFRRPRLGDLPLQPRLVRALADEREVDRVGGQPGGGVGDPGQALGDAVGAQVEHEAVTRRRAQGGPHRGIGSRGGIEPAR